LTSLIKWAQVLGGFLTVLTLIAIKADPMNGI
jgi:hypothetical protein